MAMGGPTHTTQQAQGQWMCNAPMHTTQQAQGQWMRKAPMHIANTRAMGGPMHTADATVMGGVAVGCGLCYNTTAMT